MTKPTVIAGIAAAIGAYGFSFGVLAATAGLAPIAVLAMSALAYSGGAQAAFVATLSTGTPGAALVAGVLTNLRLAIYGTLASRILEARSLGARLVGIHLSSDETIALAASAPRNERAKLYWSSGLTFFVVWVTATVAGAFVGEGIGDPARFGLDAAFPAVFVALLVPMVRSDRVAMRAAIAATAATVAVTPFVPAGLPILAAVAAGLAATLTASAARS